MAEAVLAVASNLETFVEPLKARMDRERKLPTEIVDLMRQNGLLALWLPVDWRPKSRSDRLDPSD